jgi:hypothetical protein
MHACFWARQIGFLSFKLPVEAIDTGSQSKKRITDSRALVIVSIIEAVHPLIVDFVGGGEAQT